MTMMQDDSVRAAALIERLRDTARHDLAIAIGRVHGDLAWVADDGNAEVEYDHLTTAREAAEEYVADGDWGGDSETSWVTVYVYPRYRIAGGVEIDDLDARAAYSVEIEATEPECVEGEEHDWQSPHEIVGGIEENPGVRGHGGGVIMQEVCMICGCGRKTDTWAQRSDTGEQGLTSVSYEPGQYADAIPSPAERALRRIQCDILRRCAAYVLADLGGPDSRDLDGVPDEHVERTHEIVRYARAVRERARAMAADEDRAVRLALRLAARDENEALAARRIAAVLVSAAS